MSFILIFILLSIINVIFSTVRSIVLINGNKYISSLLSGGYFAFYNIMLIYTVVDFPLWQKCLITFVCNVIGVFVVKVIEEKSRKDKLWKIEVTFPIQVAAEIDRSVGVSHSYIVVDNEHVIFNFYCENSRQSELVRDVIKKYNGKYFVSESKSLY